MGMNVKYKKSRYNIEGIRTIVDVKTKDRETERPGVVDTLRNFFGLL